MIAARIARIGSGFAFRGWHLIASALPSQHRAFSKTPTRMVEGHQCHRVAHFHRQKLCGRKFQATSPNGRLTEGAAAISAAGTLHRIEVHGKNLFYMFGDPEAPVVLHFHFGMAGTFSLHPLPAPEPKATCRLQLVADDDAAGGEGVAAQLSAMTVQHGDMAFYTSKVASLGEDPLREDADPEAAWTKVAASRKPIGLLLMDQSVVAGVGNIYRAEVLFKAGVHPEQPGNSLSKTTWEEVWRQCVDLLQRGFQSGSILTVDPEEAAALGPPWTRRYVYNQSRCGRCGSTIKTWDMAARTVHACATCQPLQGALTAGAAGTTPTAAIMLPEARRKALAAASPAAVFNSHCAPDDPREAATPPGKLTLSVLRSRLLAAGLPTSGRKAELIARLEAVASSSDGDKGTLSREAEASLGGGKAAAAAGGPALPAMPTPNAVERRKKRLRSTAGTVQSPAAALAAAAAAAGGGGGAIASGGAGGGRSGMQQRVEGASKEAVLPEVYDWDFTGPAQQAQQAQQQGMSPAQRQRKRVQGSAAAELPKPGTAGLGHVATAKEAAQEKVAAGEGRNVEHVALQDDVTVGARRRSGKSGRAGAS